METQGGGGDGGSHTVQPARLRLKKYSSQKDWMEDVAFGTVGKYCQYLI